MSKGRNFILYLLFVSALLIPACGEDEGDEAQGPAITYDYVIAKDGSGDFTSVQEAFDAVPFLKEERTYIFIKNGVYEEVVTLEKKKNNITLIGEDVSNVILTYGNYASKINPDTGEEYGTSGSSSGYFHGDNFYAKNITFENSSGPVGQALAVYINGDQAVFENCRFLGYQDTMYGGRSRQYFKNCYIEGSTDFIFGPATAWFENCELYTKGGSAITAASTEDYVDYGYVFSHCSITGSGQHITTLGRPWRPYAAVVFLNTELSESIKPEGWDNWGDPENEKTARYAEYGNSGAGASMEGRVEWITQFTDIQAATYTVKNVFKTTYANPAVEDNWDPEIVIGEVNAYLDKVEIE